LTENNADDKKIVPCTYTEHKEATTSITEMAALAGVTIGTKDRVLLSVPQTEVWSMRTRSFRNERLLVAVAAVSLATVPVACGSYSSGTASSGGAVGNPSGGSTVTPSGGSGDNASGGATVTSSGGVTVTPSGGATVTLSGGATVTPSGGATGSGGARNGGATGNGGASNGGATGNGGAAGGTSAGGATGAGGSSAAVTGGATSTGGGSAGTGGNTGVGGSTAAGALPCDVLNNAGTACVAAHSTVRVIVTGYTGPLYQVCKGTANAGPSSCKGTTQDVGSVAGYANAAAQDTFCAGATCTITKIYDQSGKGNHLEPSPTGQHGAANNPASATALKITISGHSAYGVLIKPGMGYRTGCTTCNIKTGIGVATGDTPETEYMVTSQTDLVNSCCFDYGNAETTSHDDGNGTMEAVYFGGGVVWGTGSGGVPGPWVMADIENELCPGWNPALTTNQDRNVSTNMPLKFNFVTAILLGDTAAKNAGLGRFALLGSDATSGTLQTMYDGMRPTKNGGGYVPMKKEGSIILGTGGDNSNTGGGHFYEGAMATGPVATTATLNALQAAIVAANYGK
jgi:hypothetical protein